jgi:hypothetical protein
VVLGALAALATSEPAWGAAIFAEVHLADDSLLSSTSPAPQGARPVLFIHGHNLLSPNDADFNYRKNWHDSLDNLPSFKQTLDLAENSWLNIEPYYIRFQDQTRSIFEDAREIADAVEYILARHDPTYTPYTGTPSTAVKVALIAYSKGTISARLYLKSLHVDLQQFNLPPPRPGFNPISEFVALSPPNHGLNGPAFSLAARQLNNGYRENCTSFLLNGESLNFIQNLNDHAIQDTLPPSPPDPSWSPGAYPDEARGSRPNGAPVTAGTLYATIYADGNRDFVGGSVPSSDCQGRVLARNLAPDAVNIEVPEIPGGTDGVAVHQNTVHTPEAICLALSTVVHHKAPSADFRCPITGQIPRIPPRAAVIQVLDFSGSMLSPACPACDPKLDVLKDAVELFLQLWAVAAGPGDRIGATYFGTQVEPFAIGGQSLLELSTANVAALIGDVQGRGTLSTNLTAMGGGLQRGIEALEDPAAAAIPQRHVILFTDGMQNVNPMVVRVDDSPPPGAFHLEIANVPGRPASNVSPAQPPRRLDAALGLKVHTVGVGASAQFVDLLAEIAQATSGSTRITTAPDQDLRQFFVEEVIEALQGNSPQLVDYRRGSLEGAGAAERFRVGRGATRIILKLSWKRQEKEKLGFRVEKDGVDVSDLGRFVDGPFYRIFAVNLPARRSGQPVGSEGEWAMKISGRGAAQYEAAAIVDQPDLWLQVILDRSIRVGDPLELRAKVFVGGLAAGGVRRVMATVLKPGDSVANLLAHRTLPQERPGSPPEAGDPLHRKLQLVMMDDRLVARLQPVPQSLSLVDRGDGTYAAAFAEATVPGPYRIVVTVEGSDPRIGEFHRMETRTAFVRFGRTDLATSGLELAEMGRDRAGRHLRLALRPRDRYGNYLGPGQAHLIRVSLAPGSAGAGPRDQLDGGYAIPLYVPLEADPTVTLDVQGQVVFNGPLSQLGRRVGRLPVWQIVLILAPAFILFLTLLVAWARRARPSP